MNSTHDEALALAYMLHRPHTNVRYSFVGGQWLHRKFFWDLLP